MSCPPPSPLSSSRYPTYREFSKVKPAYIGMRLIFSQSLPWNNPYHVSPNQKKIRVTHIDSSLSPSPSPPTIALLCTCEISIRIRWWHRRSYLGRARLGISFRMDGVPTGGGEEQQRGGRPCVSRRQGGGKGRRSRSPYAIPRSETSR